MAAFRIAVIGGDGIGPEVIDQAVRVADAALRREGAAVEWNRLPWSGSYYRQTGRIMPAAAPAGTTVPQAGIMQMSASLLPAGPDSDSVKEWTIL